MTKSSTKPALAASVPLKIKVEQKALLAALKLVRQVVGRKPPIPILSHVKLSAGVTGDCVLTIAGTDLESDMEVTLPCDGEGEATVDAVALTVAVEACAPKAKGKDASPRIALELVVAAKGGMPTVKVRGLAELAVNAPLEVSDFPKGVAFGVTGREVVKYNATELLAALDFVWPAICTDSTGYHLSGVLFDNDKVVTTDGHRMHLHGGLPPVKSQAHLMPRRGVGALRACLKGRKAKVEATYTAAGARFVVEGITFTVKLIDAQFPPYKQVLPNVEYCEQGFVADRGQFLAALKAVAPMTNPCTGGVVFRAVHGELSVTADNPDTGEAKSVFAGAPRKGNMQVGVNVYYWIDLVSSLDTDLITVLSSGELDPLRVDDGPRTAVIMPMRI